MLKGPSHLVDITANSMRFLCKSLGGYLSLYLNGGVTRNSFGHWKYQQVQSICIWEEILSMRENQARRQLVGLCIVWLSRTTVLGFVWRSWLACFLHASYPSKNHQCSTRVCGPAHMAAFCFHCGIIFMIRLLY